MIGPRGEQQPTRARMKNLPKRRILVAVLGLACGPLAAQEPIRLAQAAELADLSLEQLTNITVTSASRRPERVIEAPASIFVLTAEDIRRSGATTLPELLRLAPNLQVVRADTSQYVVTARGNISCTANKMLVLVDGRTIYTPLFAGVFWDAQNVMIEDLERIEVISGPGSTLWGTNAVNGVINITTRSAGKTQGTLVAVGGGGEERGISARTGGKLADDGTYRVYGKYFDRTDHALASGATARDAAGRWQAGFRTDWERATRSTTVQGDVYSANVDNLGGARDISGGNLLARWRAQMGADSEGMLQAYYDRTEREHAGSFSEKRDTADIEYQQAFHRLGRHEVVVGGGYRASRDRTLNTPVLGFMPTGRTLSLASLFAQDEVALGGKLRATVGLRAERNSYTGLEWLPNLRLAYAFSPDHLAWTALTRTVRSPSRIDRDVVVPGMPPYVVLNNDSFKSEIANVAEAGYRAQLAPRVSVSLTVFHHEFRELRTLELAAPNLVFANSGEGRATGIEGWGDFGLARDWRLVWGFTRLNERYRIDPGHADVQNSNLGNDPKLTASLRSLWTPARGVELDMAARYVAELPNPKVPAHTVVDLRAGWRVSREVEVSLRIGNLLNRKYSEIGTPAERAVFERSAFLKVTWTP
jgi:iron complex outermembrane receptor protein